MTPERWLQMAGIGTWTAATLPVLVAAVRGRMGGWVLAVWAVAAAVYLAGFAAISWSAAPRRRRAVAIALLVAQSCAALVMVTASRDGVIGGALLVVVAGELLAFVPTRAGAWWVAAQTLALVVLFSRFQSLVSAVTYGAAFGGFQLFALGTSALAHRERRARQELAAANVELHATRTLMAEHSRVAERLRIARDLHDTLGHHLTALSLQLDVASRLASGPAADQLVEAHGLARLLLADVRDVVGRTREGGRVELVRAIRELARDPTGGLAVHVEAPAEIPLTDDGQTQALLRCVQEIVTNALRHAQAGNLWLRLDATADGVIIHARDDGRGTTTVRWGHGLTGMRERIEALNGRLEVSSAAGAGFEVRGFVPRTRAVA